MTTFCLTVGTRSVVFLSLFVVNKLDGGVGHFHLPYHGYITGTIHSQFLFENLPSFCLRISCVDEFSGISGLAEMNAICCASFALRLFAVKAINLVR